VPAGKVDGLVVRLGIGILVVAQSMIFGLALNLHDDVPSSVRSLVQSAILVATLVVMTLLGGPLFAAAWRELRRGRLTLEALFLLTMSGAMAASLQAHITGRGKIYFEVVSVLLVVHTLGKLIGARSRAAALAGSRSWAGQLSTCRLVDAKGRARRVPVTEVVSGDIVEVDPGETVAVDGVIRTGTGFMSEAPVSGEPFAIVRRPGDRVLAGTASYDAAFRIEATSSGTERQVDRLLEAVDEARGRPVSLQHLADRLGRVFLPLIVLTAIGTFAYWTYFTSGGWEEGLFNAMSVLLVACPCVIGLAIPIVIWSAVGRLAERGLVIRAGDAVERLSEVDRVYLDKTGTLTDDSFALLDIATTSSGEERARLLGWLAVIQERSRHPIARPFAQLPRAAGAEPAVMSFTLVPGCGVAAVIEDDGQRHEVRIGTPDWIGSRGNLEHHLQATGHRVHVAADGEVAAIAVLAERVRDSAAETIAAFHKLGLEVEVLTGDTTERAKELDLAPARGRLLPADKHAIVAAAQAAGGKPLFVGDGINDASALAAAHVGIALAAGTDIAVGSATVTLYHSDLRVLPWAIELSREAMRSVRRNLRRALIYNLIGMSLAACGVLHPVAAALLMVVSSLSLIFSSTRIGAGPVHCLEPSSPRTHDQRGKTAAIAHGIALALQGGVFLLLLDLAWPTATATIVLFAVLGAVLGHCWRRWSAIPHSLDMCIGMLTLGNLGMLLGWWADAGFTSLPDGGCCHCIEASREGLLKPWMWLGMLLGANIAMLFLPRRSVPQRRGHVLAMVTGGNLGMVCGMLAGGWCSAQATVESVTAAVAVSFFAMTAGMLAGMLVGAWLFEKVIDFCRGIRVLPRWFRITGTVE
jgi:heavy metal translocating P-type ATPase